MLKLNIVTYNLLAPECASQSFYSFTKPEFLDITYRWNLIEKKIKTAINTNSIICLQEVSVTWLKYVNNLFQQNNYYTVADLYGKSKNGYMGTLIAFPNKSYILNETHLVHIGNEIENNIQVDNSLWSYLLSFIWAPDTNDCWQNAQKKPNTLITLKLTDKVSHRSFYISTYHMPCEYKNPDIMSIHALTVLKTIEKLANNYPYILAGDFNFTPSSNIYELITGGDLSVSKIDPNKQQILFETSPCKKMRSAYSVKGLEPTFTNRVKVFDSSEFTDCLDYIFLSDKWLVDFVMPLEEPTEFLPSNNQGSDHLMIGATIFIL